jgi:hypothetical protein
LDEVEGENRVYDADQLSQDLEIAHRHALRALEALYSPSGPKRSTLYRMALARAQNVLIGLHKEELKRRRERGISE